MSPVVSATRARSCKHTVRETMSKLILSDLHAGPGIGSWEWLDSAGADRICEFFDSIALQGHPVVLAGDVFDRWIIPHDVQPPTMADLLTMGPAARVMSSITDLAAAVPVTACGRIFCHRP
jgi:hypothetical protein